MTTSTWLGIDVAKDTLAAHLRRPRAPAHGSFDNTPAGWGKLARWLGKHAAGPVAVCLEATGRYSEGVTEHLQSAGYAVSVINPARLKAFAQATLTRTKTDASDAALLAEYGERHQPLVTPPLRPAVAQLRALVRRRESLQQLYQAEANRLASGEQPELVRTSLQTVLDVLQAELDNIEQAIAAQVASDDELARQHALLDSIPGIGPTTAAALLGEIDFGIYPSARQVAAQAGLTPRQRQSGTSIHGKPRLSKQGASQLRKLLFFPALVARRHNPLLRAFADRLAAKGKPKMSVICAVMRKLLHLAYGVLKSGRPFDPNYQPARLRTPVPA